MLNRLSIITRQNIGRYAGTRKKKRLHKNEEERTMMKMNRKALALLVSVLLAAATAGCGNPAENNDPALEAMASLPESGKETDAGEPAVTAEPTAAPATEPTAAPTAEPTVEPTTEPTAEPTTAPTVEPTDEPTVAPTTEPTAQPESAATAEPETTEPVETTAPAETAEPAPADNAAPPALVENPPDVSGLVTNTETVTTQVEHKRPDGMPQVCYSEEEMLMAMLLYGSVGDGYTDNGDGTYTYCYCTPDGVTYDTVTTTTTTDNWYSGTEADALAKLDELRGMYPEGTYWGDDSTYNQSSTLDAYIGNSNACAGFAKLVSDYIFGSDAPVRKYTATSWNQLKPGDIYLNWNGTHVYVYLGWITEDPDGYLLDENGNPIPTYLVGSVSGNYNNSVAWDAGEITSHPDSETITVYTRWP